MEGKEGSNTNVGSCMYYCQLVTPFNCTSGHIFSAMPRLHHHSITSTNSYQRRFHIVFINMFHTTYVLHKRIHTEGTLTIQFREGVTGRMNIRLVIPFCKEMG